MYKFNYFIFKACSQVKNILFILPVYEVISFHTLLLKTPDHAVCIVSFNLTANLIYLRDLTGEGKYKIS